MPLIVDASQSAGVLEVNLTGWGAAFAAMPGHKGLYGPQGTGLLLCAAEAEPLLFGGTGSQSRRQEMPQDLPDRLEAMTLPDELHAGTDTAKTESKTGQAQIPPERI